MEVCLRCSERSAAPDGKLIACALRIPDVNPQHHVHEFGNIMARKGTATHEMLQGGKDVQGNSLHAQGATKKGVAKQNMRLEASILDIAICRGGIDEQVVRVYPIFVSHNDKLETRTKMAKTGV